MNPRRKLPGACRAGLCEHQGHGGPRRRRRYRRNPGGSRNGGGGRSNLLLYAAIGGAAYFLLLRPGGIGSIFSGAQPAIAGYTPIGGTYYRNNATGQTVQRTASGQLVTATGVVAPSGVPNWLQPTVQAGAQAIPQLGVGIATSLVGMLTGGVRALFGPSSVAQTTAPDGTATPFGQAASDVLFGGALPPLEPLPSFDLATPTFALPAEPSMTYALPPLPDLGSVQLSLDGGSTWQTDLSLAPVDTSGWFSDPGSPAF